ncbi:autoinducer binding domain-containing protein [Limimaricola pyoseonensis]|uniref:LuxR family transcriptional regulator n=1 Tax=Limimaricola pyoseonensis TaxID=521013 RepID=A0A1G7FZH4_9RHOB|nr:autoinducer binding domain-containing protein [Limimaricola pyoseonensis]SDE81288.1 LuxR family transcriptional regulator [Limimaricola pyoseonensis]
MKLHSYSSSDFDALAQLAPAGCAAVMRVSKGRPLHLENRYPEEWRATYDRKSYFLRDPTIFWGLANDGVIDWDDPVLVDHGGVMADAKAHGLRFGATVATGTAESRSFCGVARKDRPFARAELDEVLHQLQILHAEPCAELRVTPAQIEALELMAAGERHARAAARIGISESALKARLKSARDSLAARTTAEAVHAAQARGLI